MALLTYQQQQAIKPIAKNNQAFYTQIQLDTERLYLQKILGVIFAQAVQAAPENYVDLLDGCEFEYCGETIRHEGLRFILAYYTHSEYVKNSDLQDTFTGMVQQNRAETTHASSGRINAIRDTSLQIADEALTITKQYLNQNAAIYPLWNCSESRKAHAPKLIEIRNTSSYERAVWSEPCRYCGRFGSDCGCNTGSGCC